MTSNVADPKPPIAEAPAATHGEIELDKAVSCVVIPGHDYS